MNQPPSFWKQIFCKHKWQQIGDLYIYNGIQSKKAKLPTKSYRRWWCGKCQKIAKQRQL